MSCGALVTAGTRCGADQVAPQQQQPQQPAASLLGALLSPNVVARSAALPMARCIIFASLPLFYTSVGAPASGRFSAHQWCTPRVLSGLSLHSTRVLLLFPVPSRFPCASTPFPPPFPKHHQIRSISRARPSRSNTETQTHRYILSPPCLLRPCPALTLCANSPPLSLQFSPLLGPLYHQPLFSSPTLSHTPTRRLLAAPRSS